MQDLRPKGPSHAEEALDRVPDRPRGDRLCCCGRGPYLWLEEVENEKALAWTKERSATGANLTHRVYMGALTYAYMWMMLK